MSALKDVKVAQSETPDNIKAVAATPRSGRNWFVAAGLGLLLGLLIAGLCIALPIGLTTRNNNSQKAVLLNGEDGASKLQGTTRTFHLAADEVDWDYAPKRKNLCSNKPFDEVAQLYTDEGIGAKYKKGIYRLYTDESFSKLKERSTEEEHMGLLGPAIHAEVGDTLHIMLRNNLKFAVNIIAGGVKMEGAPAVNPGDTVTFKWFVPASAGPSADGPSSQFWVYRSNVDPTLNTQAGLAGPLVVTNPGGLGDNGRPKGVDKEIFFMLQVFNENNSPFYEENAAPHEDKLSKLSEEDLAESNMMYSINGYIYCNLPGLNMTVGEKVRWYVSSLGSEDAIHTAHWHGITFDHNGHHMDQAPVQSSTLLVLDAYTDNPGTWLFHCHLTDHIHGGMMALFTITGEPIQPKLSGKTREYFIAAEEEVWDYVPFGGEMCGGSKVNFSDNAKTFVQPGPDRVGNKYLKAKYVEYTDATFSQKKRRAPEWEHLGVLGPVIRGVVGDTLLVTFRNKMKNNSVSIHSHGMFYDKDSEGSPYYDGLPLALGDAVPPGETVTYTWLVSERAGPGPNDLSSVMWMYHSHVDEAADPAAGLVGGIIITTPENANEDATPKDVPREYMLSFYIMDENVSIMKDKNFQRFLSKTVTSNSTALQELVDDADFQESNLMHSINGYMYCNLPGLQFIQGQNARIYLMALGGSADMHTPNSAESQLFFDGHKRQAVGLLPGAMIAVDTMPMVSGKGLLQCHVYDHISAGMSAIYDVKNLGILTAPATAPVRTYYIAAEPVLWDYAPLGFDGCTGQPWNDISSVFVKTTKETMGSKYRKAVFREYTDDTFKTPKNHPPENGILGPMLRAEVGDKIVVYFLNKLPFDSSIQVFGGLAPLDNSTQYQVNLAQPGAPAPTVAPASATAAGRKLLRAAATRNLQQFTAAEAEAEAIIAQSVDNIYALGKVAPGGKFRYEWFVPEEAGPASKDGGSVVYTYVSGVDHIKHINAGLVGPLVVYKKGKMSSPDVDKEIPVLFNVQNEMQSIFFETNFHLQENMTGIAIDKMATSFPESNLMHQINGYLYCNGPTLQLNAGDRVRWYVMGFGSEVDMHSPVFEGQDVMYAGEATYSVALMPSNTFVLDMVANTTGTWNYYCNILDHIWAGMSARMVVS